ncbi:MAG: hypothetical protein HN352_08215 [Bacteroidetes bacterium]|jgi:cytosolic carboxypeptidase protein 6|nr:hypothetical protein [Bacteroidota bacterium]MBT3750069.1 hypothetical protein [Bacteroidota bacterium]MBT4401255.1 hypothetical protein [Bacteroidota bacterium]MBT4408250.1 hypothetical protein [Bacteroidota bacterium]MBT5427442.1 hypothetical protein [Bacteroidota bacterium]
MKTRIFAVSTLLFALIVSSCSLLRYQAKYIEPNPRVDTHSKTITNQIKKKYTFNQGTISFDNLFDMARMNDCRKLNDSTYTISILPENTPINASPWYAFRINSRTDQTLYINLEYTAAKHRYKPKASYDGNLWIPLEDDQIHLSNGDSVATIKFNLQAGTTWIAGQELFSSGKVMNWCQNLSHSNNVEFHSFGTSKEGRPLIFMDIYSGKKRKKPIVVILARQHPPEVSGHLAMQSFVETLLEKTPLTQHFHEKYRLLVYPILNPDGVDLGHWRHNTGGIDLNRDWGNYNQPEIRQVADHIVKQSKVNRSEVILGIDFHSTHYDIYYTNDVDPGALSVGTFTSDWIDQIDKVFPEYTPRVEASEYLPVATSKNWFYAEFQTEGIIYEVGDNTPRDFISEKARVAAIAMMKILTE